MRPVAHDSAPDDGRPSRVAIAAQIIRRGLPSPEIFDAVAAEIAGEVIRAIDNSSRRSARRVVLPGWVWCKEGEQVHIEVPDDFACEGDHAKIYVHPAVIE